MDDGKKSIFLFISALVLVFAVLFSLPTISTEECIGACEGGSFSSYESGNSACFCNCSEESEIRECGGSFVKKIER